MKARPQRGSGAGAAAVQLISQNSVIVALIFMIVFGSLRYDHFLGVFNVLTVLRYNSMFALISLGMCFVIMSGGIDLSVGAAAALGSVVSALLSPYGLWAGLLGGTLAGGVIGLLNAVAITRLRIAPFIATLAAMLAARGAALLVANNQSVSVSYDTDFTQIGQGDFLGFPIPAWLAGLLFVAGSIALNLSPWGRYLLAIGGNEDASRLMGLPVDRVTFSLYLLSGLLSGLAGVILAAQFGAGQPTEGVGWELFAIASVVVGGTLLTGGQGSVITTLAGVLLLGLIFNILNFENGLGWISLSAYWQSVIRGAFLMLVVIFQSKLTFGRLPAR
jgi:ribose/xylose/arabinose/galactoside ABC-type transport system permease subunit